LIIGPSGCGKSTITLHLTATGWNFSTDDVVLLTERKNRVVAYGLREGFRLTAETIVKSGLSQMDTVLQREPTGADLKLPMQPQEFFPSRFIKNCVPELLFFPRQTGEDQSRIEPLGQASAMKRLLRMCPWACIDLPTSSRFLNVLNRLVRQCPSFELQSGLDLLDSYEYTASFLGSVIRRQTA